MNYQPSLLTWGNTQCACCGKVVPLTEAVVVTRHITETFAEQEHFCTDTCAASWKEAFHERT